MLSDERSLENGYNELQEGADESQKKMYKEDIKKNALSLRYLHASVSKNIFPHLYGINKVKDAWETLKSNFFGNEKLIAVKLQSAWQEFRNT